MNKNIKIAIEKISVAYDVEPVIWDITCDIESSKMTAIVGPNGAGKSTLFKTILGIKKPLTGSVTINDNNFFSYVPQTSNIDWDFPATVFDVVLMGRYHKLGWFSRPTKEDKKIALESLKKVDLYDFRNRQINDLSGGQKQRVFLARALAQQTDIYLLDEPFQAVDSYSENTIISILKNLVKDGKTIVVVHHDLNKIPEYFDNVILINKNVIASGKVEEVFTKENINKTYSQRPNFFESGEIKND